jgi:hypothetical protein
LALATPQAVSRARAWIFARSSSDSSTRCSRFAFAYPYSSSELTQALLPLTLERPSNHAIVRIDSLVAPLGVSRFVRRLLQTRSPLALEFLTAQASAVVPCVWLDAAGQGESEPN